MTKQYNSLFTEYDSLPPDDQLTAREEAFKDCYELNYVLLEILRSFVALHEGRALVRADDGLFFQASEAVRADETGP